jgi:Domain of unknown function (DUF1996)
MIRPVLIFVVAGLLAPASAVAVAASVAKPSVSFVVQCLPSHEGPDDPLMHPGHNGMSHQHSFFGNRSTDSKSTVASLGKNPKSSCDTAGDASAYWTPTPVGAKWVGMRAYYDAGLIAPASIQPHPFGLGMIAGRGLGSVSWSCGRSPSASGWAARPTPCEGKRALTAMISFPQCWDGKHGYLAESKHMADVVGRKCPTTHPVSLARLRLVFRLNGSQVPAALASGPIESMHADFLNAWSVDPLATLVSTCVRGERTTSSELRTCRPKTAEPQPL